jgi:hypothetical protein
MKRAGWGLFALSVVQLAMAGVQAGRVPAQGNPSGELAEKLGAFTCPVIVLIPAVALIFLGGRTRLEGGRRHTSRQRRRWRMPVGGVRPKLSLAELTLDPRYAEAVQIVYRAVTALPRLPSGAPDPEAIRAAFESGVSHLIAAGIASDEARINLRRLIAAEATGGSGSSDSEAEPNTEPDRR